MSDYILNIVKHHKSGNPVGIFSICSANKYVLEASIRYAKQNNEFLLIEATSNQVDQFGGYTGLTPDKFKDIIKKLADSINFPFSNIILGGDHLGPNVWQKESSSSAMNKAKDQIKEYIKAGFTKIHLDTSMKCADDLVKNDNRLDPEIIAERAAVLCKIAEETSKETMIYSKPVYVIGTDVPIPGGALEDLDIDDIRITPPEEVDETINLTKYFFEKYGLNDAWLRTVAVVVQPGIEFSNSKVAKYESKKASKLVSLINKYDNFVYEAHSTDFQTKNSLRRMIEDHFAILKVGPWLTFAFREAVFALANIEKELFSYYKNIRLSNICETLDYVMEKNPKYWNRYYKGTKQEIEFAKRYSFSDRIRYYWSYEEVDSALNLLIHNLTKNIIPLNLLSQYMPIENDAVMEGRIENNPKELILHRIMSVLEKYNYAVKGVN